MSLDASLGKSVAFRAGVGTGAVFLVSDPSRETGRVVPASSASVRLTRFTKGLSSLEGASRDVWTTRIVDWTRGRLLLVKSVFDWLRFSGVGMILVVDDSAKSIFDCVRFNDEVGALGMDSIMSILDCVRFNDFGVFVLDSVFVRSDFEADFCRARKADGWLAMESIFLNSFCKKTNVSLCC